jgi:hypothetical protein
MARKDKAKAAAYDKAYYEAKKEHKKAYGKSWYEANRERKAATDKAWRAANKERTAALNRAWRAANPGRQVALKRKRRTGFSPEQYQAKLVEQGGRCGICGVEKCSSGNSLAADHCHASGKPRGVLCAKCNTAIGKLGDNAAGVLKAVAYLLAYEVETNWEPITNDEHTIDEGATDHTQDVQPTHERCGDRVRDVGADGRSRN